MTRQEGMVMISAKQILAQRKESSSAWGSPGISILADFHEQHALAWKLSLPEQDVGLDAHWRALPIYFFYGSLILPGVESCNQEELASFVLLKTIFPWVALLLACCCCCCCQKRNKAVGWSLLGELALSSRYNPYLCPSLPKRRVDSALGMSVGAVLPPALHPLCRSSQILP